VRPVVSCIVPVFNGERHLGAALASLLVQTAPLGEIIVVDAGSTDGSADVVASFGSSVQSVHRPGSGPAAARNWGLGLAQGDFVAFLDQDDLWHPEKLARQLVCFEARPALDACITFIQKFWEPGFEDDADFYAGYPRGAAVPGYVSTTLLARRSVFDLVGSFNPALRFSDASDWFLRAAERGVAVELLPEVLVYHRQHRSNLTRREDQASRDEFLHFVKRALDRQRVVAG
jgi:glycosyltransferase involved in cell wall biosynthesis